MRLKHLLRMEYGDALAAADRQDGTVRVYGSNGPVGRHRTRNMRPPSIVVGRKGSHGKVTWAPDGGFCIDTAFYIDERHTPGCLRYVYYLLQTLNLDEHSRDSAVPGLDRSEAYNKRIPQVPLREQKRIADFLDRETARIDGVIQKKNSLIGLLREKVRASLVERFGYLRAPSRRLRLLGSLKNGAGFPVAEQGNPHGEIAFFKVKHLAEAAFPSRLTKADDYVSREVARRLGATVFPADTIVFAKIGAALLLSRFTVLGNQSCIDNNMSAFVPNEGVLDPEYARLALSTIPMVRYANPGAVPSLNTTAFLEHAIKVPSITDQKSFVAESIATMERLRRVTTTVESSLSVLDELRLALISGAIAGQIDV